MRLLIHKEELCAMMEYGAYDCRINFIILKISFKAIVFGVTPNATVVGGAEEARWQFR